LLIGRPAVAIAGFALVGLVSPTWSQHSSALQVEQASFLRECPIAAVASAGYAGLLAGPPLIGFAAQAFTLTHALFVVVLCCGRIAVLAPMVRRSN
jgi:hypothetical protein